MIEGTELKQTDTVIESVGVYMEPATALHCISKLKKERDRVQHLLVECRGNVGRNKRFIRADPKKITVLEVELRSCQGELIDARVLVRRHKDEIKIVTAKIGESDQKITELEAKVRKLTVANSSLLNANGVLASKTIANAKRIMADAISLMKAKNADYGDSWRMMRTSSITDQILVKVHRIRSIEESPDALKVSEGIESEYRDILNYCVFAMIQIQERSNDKEPKQAVTAEV